jgi:peroxiredoxin Q/BCP
LTITDKITPRVGFRFLLNQPEAGSWFIFHLISLIDSCCVGDKDLKCAALLTRKNGSKNMLKEGTVAPNFSANNANGETVQLKALRGQKVVLYFYPKDDTPGCTKEACSFRDAFADFRKRGIEVLGVSVDSEASHKKFTAKYKLPFTLLADPDHSIADAYGVYGEKKFMGRTYMGVKRITFLIDEKGKIKKVFEKVKPEEHARDVLEAFANK